MICRDPIDLKSAELTIVVLFEYPEVYQVWYHKKEGWMQSSPVMDQPMRVRYVRSDCAYAEFMLPDLVRLIEFIHHPEKVVSTIEIKGYHLPESDKVRECLRSKTAQLSYAATDAGIKT